MARVTTITCDRCGAVMIDDHGERLKKRDWVTARIELETIDICSSCWKEAMMPKAKDD